MVQTLQTDHVGWRSLHGNRHLTFQKQCGKMPWWGWPAAIYCSCLSQKTTPTADDRNRYWSTSGSRTNVYSCKLLCINRWPQTTTVPWIRSHLFLGQFCHFLQIRRRISNQSHFVLLEWLTIHWTESITGLGISEAIKTYQVKICGPAVDVWINLDGRWTEWTYVQTILVSILNSYVCMPPYRKYSEWSAGKLHRGHKVQSCLTIWRPCRNRQCRDDGQCMCRRPALRL